MTESRPLHPSSLIFQFSALLKQSLFPVILVGWNAAKGSWIGILGVCLFCVAFLALSIIRYLTFRYRIESGELIVTEGLLFRSKRNVPVDRIQNIDLLQNVFHRLLGVAEVRVETASGTKPEAVLKVLSVGEVQRLQAEVRSRADSQNRLSLPDGSHATAAQEVSGNQQADRWPSRIEFGDEPARELATQLEPVSDEQTLLRIPVRLLILAGLASNRGFVIVGIVLGLFFQQDGAQRYRWDEQLNEVVQYVPWLNSWGVWVGLAIAALVVIRLLGIAWYLLRFFDYRLTLHDESLHLSCGGLTKVSATVPRRRIQLISIHRTWLQRRLGIAAIRIETAGGAGRQNENAATTVTRRWFVPVIAEADVNQLVSQLRSGLRWEPGELNWRGLERRAGRRMRRVAVVKALLLTLACYLAGLAFGDTHWGWLIGLAGLALLLTNARRRLRFFGFARLLSPAGVAFRSGIWTQKTSLTFCDRLQTVTLSETPFDRRWGMKTLRLDTAASGPAEHPIRVPMLDAVVAEEDLRELAHATAQVKMTWD